MGLLRRLPLAGLVGLLTCACMAAGPEATPIGQPAPGHAAYAVGYKGLSSGWSGADDHFVFGLLDGVWRPPGWPVWIAGQMLFSYSDDAPDSAPFYADYGETYEFSLGLRRYTSKMRMMLIGSPRYFGSLNLTVLTSPPFFSSKHGITRGRIITYALQNS